MCVSIYMVCSYACLFKLPTYHIFEMSAVKYFTMIECQAHQDVLQLSYENEHEGQFASYKTTFRTATEE